MSLEVHDHAGARLIEIARADKGNALGAGLVESLIDAVDRAYGDDAIDTLVLCARGRNFCTGLDLSDLDSVSDGDLLLRLVRIETLLARIWHAPIRTVAIAQGRCWGAGADLFAACEQRFATADATFRFPGVQFGILLGTRRLADRIGVEPARAILTEGRQLDAIAGRDLRLVDSIAAAPADDTGSVDPGAFEPVSFATRWLDRQPAITVGRALARALREATRPDHRDEDLARLVNSASLPGLRQRIVAYRERTAKPRAR